MIRFSAILQVWTNDEGSSHFVRIPPELASDIKAHSMLVHRGFGSVKVEVNVRDCCWQTSIFPSTGGGYFLPVKIAVVRGAGLCAGDLVSIELRLL